MYYVRHQFFLREVILDKNDKISWKKNSVVLVRKRTIPVGRSISCKVEN
jgi:hypothetical protein